MLNILRYLKKHVGMAVLILALLCVQAYCDLTLPKYTSDIVDVGIQQSGVERVTPNQMRDTTLEALTLFLSNEDEALLRRAYAIEDGTARLTVSDSATLDRLDQALSMPMVALYQMGQQGMEPSVLIQQSEQVGVDRETFKIQLRTQMETMTDQYGAAADTMTSQMAILFVRQEYQALGVDLDALQQTYLLTTGGKMLALTLLMVAAAITAGMLASRVAAAWAWSCGAGYSARWCPSGVPKSTASPPPPSSPGPPTTFNRSRWWWSCCCVWCSMHPSSALAASSG